MSNAQKRTLFLALMVVVVSGFVWALLFDVTVLEKRFGANQKTAEQGRVALNGFEERIQEIDGEWEFYWQRYLSKSDFAQGPNQTGNPLYLRSPGVWNNLTVDGKHLPGFGYGTFRLHVSGLPKNVRIGIYVPVLSVAYSLYANDELIAANGNPASDPAKFAPGYVPQIAFFRTSTGETDFIIHTSNYVYARNGMWHPLYLGTEEQVEQLNRSVIYKDLFMIGAFVTLALYYVSLFGLRRDKQSLYFVLLCVGAILRMLVNGDRALLRLFDGLPFSLLIKIDYATLVLFYPVMLFLMARRFPKEFSRIVSRSFVGLGVVTALLVFILPVHIFTRYVQFAEIILFASILYTLGGLVAAVLRLRKNAFAMFFSIALLLTLTVRDLMYQSALRDNPIGEISAFGFFIFLLMESFAISRDYAESYREAERLSLELIENDHLKDRIRATEMAFFQSQIKPHFLFNSLSAIDEYCQIDPKEASRLIGSLSQYLRQSFDFENLENTVSIEKELALVRSYVDIESARFDDLLVSYHVDYQNDFSLPPLTIQPLVENAIRHGVRKKAGSGIVSVEIRQQGDDVLIAISDDGAGIPQDRLPSILVDTGRNKRVGLINIHYRLLRMYGTGLSLQSEYGKGTTVSFAIPVEGH